MVDLVRGALAWIAIGGFAAAVVDANINAVKALCRVNRLAAEMTWFTFQAIGEKIERDRQQPVEDEYDTADKADDEDEN